MKYLLSAFFFFFVFVLEMNAAMFSVENNITTPIVDNTCFNKTFNFPTSVIIGSATMEVNLTHTWRGDLNLTLTSPLGTVVDLSSRNGGAANNVYANFTDNATVSIVGDTTNHTTLVQRLPEVSLGAFVGEDALGVWNLQVCDNAAGDVGTYNVARLDINDTVLPLNTNLSVDYRMDECYWMGNVAGILNDVKDSSPLKLDATSYNTAQIVRGVGTIPPLCNSGLFNGTTDSLDVINSAPLVTNNTFTVGGWINPANFVNTFSVLMMKTSNYVDGFTFYIYWDGVNPTVAKVVLLTGDGTNRSSASTLINANVWSHVVATYDGSKIQIYVNGVLSATTLFTANILNANQPLKLGVGLSNLYYYNGQMDEFKIWDRILSNKEVNATYQNELLGNNFDGSARVCPTCDSNLTASTWELVGVPADLRTAVTKDVATVFDEFNATTYDTLGNPNDWVVYKRDYNNTTNASSYSVVPYAGVPLEIGKGYWLISSVAKVWSENGLPTVDYNSTNPACVTNSCIEIDLVAANKNFGAPDFDPNDGSGQYRNNMLGFVGHVPVNWADCRIVVSDINGTTSYTPSGAFTAGYAEKQIWQYNPGAVGANANGYTTCDDTLPGGCKLEPYKGFWVRLFGTTKGKSVKLLIPKAL